ncbi:putative GNAT family acetyltransferase [Sesbania bispinosa]|nr:putative GNAT family acetyltransferase [Sesbania bispinosa]
MMDEVVSGGSSEPLIVKPLTSIHTDPALAEAAQKAMLEDEEFEKAAGTKRKRPSKAARSKQRRLLSPDRKEDLVPALMITRSKSIPKDGGEIF